MYSHYNVITLEDTHYQIKIMNKTNGNREKQHGSNDQHYYTSDIGHNPVKISLMSQQFKIGALIKFNFHTLKLMGFNFSWITSIVIRL